METMQFSTDWLIAGIVAAVAGLFFFYLLHRRKQESSTPADPAQTALVPGDRAQPDVISPFAFEEIPALSPLAEANLVEVKDPAVVKRVAGMIPGAGQVLMNVGAIASYQDKLAKMGEVHRCVLKAGQELTKAKDGTGEVLGIIKENGKIVAHAKWEQVDPNIGSSLVSAGILNAVMGVAAMVVSQYYMAEINQKLETISKDVHAITVFQENEYKSQVTALLLDVRKTSIFQAEIMAQEELRQRELDKLSRLEHECAQLLTHANETLKAAVSKGKLEFGDYEKKVRDMQKWYEYRNVLLQVLAQISELTFALSLGKATRAYCYTTYEACFKQTAAIQHALQSWHDQQADHLGISVEGAVKERKQLLEKAVGALPGQDKYIPLPKDTVTLLRLQQRDVEPSPRLREKDFFQQDVELIAREGRLYYAPPKAQQTA